MFWSPERGRLPRPGGGDLSHAADVFLQRDVPSWSPPSGWADARRIRLVPVRARERGLDMRAVSASRVTTGQVITAMPPAFLERRADAAPDVPNFSPTRFEALSATRFVTPAY